MTNLDGDDIIEDVIEEYKLSKINPFDFVNAINNSKEPLMVDDWSERQYNPYIVNKALSFGADTVLLANEMNIRPHLEKRLQFDFLMAVVKPKKRFNKWLKPEKVELVEVVKKYYGYNTEKAIQALKLLSEKEMQIIKERIFTGGVK